MFCLGCGWRFHFHTRVMLVCSGAVSICITSHHVRSGEIVGRNEAVVWNVCFIKFDTVRCLAFRM